MDKVGAYCFTNTHPDFILYFALVLPGYPDLIERYAKFLVRHFSDSRIVITGNIKLLISTRKCSKK